jgi:glutamate synthase (NADPH/NADH) large chain
VAQLVPNQIAVTVQEFYPIPDAYYREVAGFELPPVGQYATGIAFIDPKFSDYDGLKEIVEAEGATVLGWRELPIDASNLGKTALSVMPKFMQIFIKGNSDQSELGLDRLAFRYPQAN